MSKYGVISGPCFPVFVLNTVKYGPEITPYLDGSHAVTAFTSKRSSSSGFSISLLLKVIFYNRLK